MTISKTPNLMVRFLAFFKNGENTTVFPEITYNDRELHRTLMPCFQKAQIDDAVLASLNTLHPQVRHFMGKLVTRFGLARPLNEELKKTRWKAKAPAWAISEFKNLFENHNGSFFFTFKITEIQAFQFPTGIFALSIDLEPDFLLTGQTAIFAGKMLIDVFVRTGATFTGGRVKGAPMMRVFDRDEKRESVKNRLGENELALIAGFCGQDVTLPDIVKGLLPKECMVEGEVGEDAHRSFIMGDRFLTSTFLKTGWDGCGDVFSAQDYIDLVRLSRGEGDFYIPTASLCRPGSNGIVTTFENVAFALSAEGISCWVKPAEYQEFLNNQFDQRFWGIYFELYLLGLHQRYALIDLARRLDETTPKENDLKRYNSIPRYSKRMEGCDYGDIEEKATELRIFRAEVSNFYLRAFFQQPATLTNYQEFYHTLQDVLGISVLLEEVRQATSELEYLIGSFDQKIQEFRYHEKRLEQDTRNTKIMETIKALMNEQEKMARNELFLTLVVEFAALPYYTYNFLAKAANLCHETSLLISATITILAVLYTGFKFLENK